MLLVIIDLHLKFMNCFLVLEDKTLVFFNLTEKLIFSSFQFFDLFRELLLFLKKFLSFLLILLNLIFTNSHLQFFNVEYSHCLDSQLFFKFTYLIQMLILFFFKTLFDLQTTIITSLQFRFIGQSMV